MATEPMHVYPDPDGTANSNAYVPSNTATATGATVSGAISVAAAAPAVGPILITNALAFMQNAYAGNAQEVHRFMGLHDLKPGYVAIVVFFGSLSVLLQVINLVRGLRMKERLRKLSAQVCGLCEKAGLLKAA
jgi:hypothetical protein